MTTSDSIYSKRNVQEEKSPRWPYAIILKIEHEGNSA